MEVFESRCLLSAITVTSLADNMTADGQITLREAIQAANTDTTVDGVTGSGDDTITFAAGLTSGGPATIRLNGTELVIASNLTINGPGASLLTINGDSDSNGTGNSRIFLIEDFNNSVDKVVSISGLTLTNGSSSGAVSFSGHGGAIFNEEQMSLDQCLVSNSVADYYGGGIYNYNHDGFTTISNTTFSGNSAVSGGGAIVIDNGTTGTCEVTNCLVVGNNAYVGGGIVTNGGMSQIVNCTVASNAAVYGGGIYADGPITTLTNTIVAENVASNGPDLYRSEISSVTSNGFNLIGNTSGGIGWIASDLQNVAPQFVDSVTGNYRLNLSSPAIDAGTNTGAPNIDLDGRMRPIDGDSNGSAITDIGAYESEQVDLGVISVNSVGSGGWARGVADVRLHANGFSGTWTLSLSIDGINRPFNGATQITGSVSGLDILRTFDSTTLVDGTHTLVARLTSPGGQFDESAPLTFKIDNQSPFVSLPPGEVNPVIEATGPTGAQFPLHPNVFDNLDPNPAVTYTPALTTYPLGQTNVSISATDAAGNTRAVTTLIKVQDTTRPSLALPPNQVNPVVDATSSAGAVVTFSPIVSDVVDLDPIIVSNVPPSGIFPIGTTLVTFTATDDSGNQTSIQTTVTVYDNRPVASFAANPNPAVSSQSIVFDASSSTHGRPDRSLVSYTWDFGDGSTGSGVSVSHAYHHLGSFAVTLTVTDDNVLPLTSAVSQNVNIVEDPVEWSISQWGSPVTEGHAATYTIGLGGSLAPTGVMPTSDQYYMATLSHSGSGSPAGTVASNVSIDGKAMTLLFDSFVAESIPVNGYETKTSVVDVALHVPEGPPESLYEFVVDTRGFAQLDVGAVGLLQSRYAVSEGGEFGPWIALDAIEFRGPNATDYHTQGVARFGSNASMLRIESTLQVVGGPVLMTVDSLDAELRRAYVLQNNETAFVQIGIRNVSTTSADYSSMATAVAAAVNTYNGALIAGDPNTFQFDGTTLIYTGNGFDVPTLAFSLAATADGLVEGNETYNVNLSNVGSTTGASVQLGEAAVSTIIVDPTGTLDAILDDAGNLTITDIDPIGKNNVLTTTLFLYDGNAYLEITDDVEQFVGVPLTSPPSTLTNGNRTIRIPLSVVTGSMTINGGSGDDVIVMTGLGLVGPLDASLIINGDGGSDTIRLNTDIAFAPGKDLNVDLTNDATAGDADSILVGANANLILAGTGTATLKTSKNIAFAPGSSMVTVDGNLVVEANQQIVPTQGNFIGITINAALIQATGVGMVTVQGRGGDGSSGFQYGVYVDVGGKIVGGTSGQVVVQGTGGAGAVGRNYGIFVSHASSTIQSAGANVAVTGHGGGVGVSDQNFGILLADGAEITAGGDGTVSVLGNGGCTSGSGSSNYGIYLLRNFSRIASNGGNVTVTGVAGGSVGSGFNHGVVVDSSEITAGGSGTVTVVGHGGNILGTDGINYGVFVLNSITSSGGNVLVTGTEGGGSDSVAIRLASIATISTAIHGGSVTLVGDSMSFVNSSVINTQINSSVTLHPRSVGVAVNLGAANDPKGGPLSLSDAELDRISSGRLIIGSDSSGVVTVSADIIRASATTIQLESAADVVINGGQINTGGGVLVLDPGVSPSAVHAPHVGVDVTAAMLSFESDLAIAVNGPLVDTDYTQLNVVGSIDLTGVDLFFSGSYLPASGDSFTIVENDGDDAILGTFNGLAEGATINVNGTNKQISYVGGTGNDVVLLGDVAPTDIALSSTVIAENNAPNMVVGVLTATDANVGDSFTFGLVTGAGDVDNASFTIVGNTLKIIPSSDFETQSSYSILIQVTDQSGLTFSKPFTINVTNVNDPPIAVNGTLNTTNGIAKSGTLSVTDVDSAPSQLTISVVTGPSHGSVVIHDVHTGAYTYTPAAGYIGPDSFTFQGNDGQSDSNIATVTITVVAFVPAPPIVIDNGNVTGYSETGSWKNKATSGPAGYLGNLRYANPNATIYTSYAYDNGVRVGSPGDVEFATSDVDTATFTFTGLPAGAYQIAVTYKAASNRATNATFTITGTGASSQTVTINQQLSPNSFTTGTPASAAWQTLTPSFGSITANGTITVTLSSAGANGYVIADAVRLQQVSPLEAAAGLAEVPVNQTLSNRDLRRIAKEAINRWKVQDLTHSQRVILNQAQFAVADLSGALLGAQAANVIYLDANAAGYGWFVDPTPNNNHEFQQTNSSMEFKATVGSRADKKMDLLTVVMHELGHSLGLAANTDWAEFMTDRLDVGIRRIPMSTKTAARPTP